MQPATQRATPKKPTTTTPVKQTKPAPPPTKKPSKRKLPQKVRKGKPAFQLVDEEDEAQQESIPQREDDDPDLNLAKKLSLEAHQEKGEDEGNDAELEGAIKLSLDPAFLPQGRAPVGGVTIRDPVSEATPEMHEVVGKGKAVVRSNPPDFDNWTPNSTRNDTSEERDPWNPSSTSNQNEQKTLRKHMRLWLDQTLETHERGPTDQTLETYMYFAGPNLSTWNYEFISKTAYPKFPIENLKLITTNTQEKAYSDDEKTNDRMMKALQLDQTKVCQQKKENLILPLLTGQQQPPPKAGCPKFKENQITDTRDAGADSSMHRSDPESEHSEQSSDDISKHDEGNDSAMEDTDNTHIPKVTKSEKLPSPISKLKAARYTRFCLEELVPIAVGLRVGKSSTICPRQQDQSSHSSQHVDKKPGDQDRVGRLQLGNESGIGSLLQPPITKTKKPLLKAKAKRSSIKLRKEHISNSLVFHTLWKQVYPKSPTHYPCDVARETSD
ncbi:hypothetical protein Tco_1143780 [Tanacetum coccineum]